MKSAFTNRIHCDTVQCMYYFTCIITVRVAYLSTVIDFVKSCLLLWCYALSFTTIYQDLNVKPREITIVKHFIGGSPTGDRSYSVGRNHKHATAAPVDYQTHW